MSSGPATVDDSPVVSPETDWNDAWYLVCMKVSTIGFVVVDARERVAALDALREGGVADLSRQLDADPGVADRLRRGMIILDANEAAVRMFGAAGRAEMIGQRTQRFFDPSCSAQINSARAFAAGATSFQQQARSVRVDGTRFDTLFCVVPRADGTTSGFWLASFVDITEHVQRQTSLDALAHVSRISTLGELSASIAHEIGQPLSSIGMTAGAMLRRLDGEDIDRDTLRRQCQRIVDQVARAGDIIDRSRRMAGKRSSTRSPVAIADVLSESVQFVQHESSHNAIVPHVGAAGPDLIIRADRIQLQQVFVNLLMNAIQIHRQAGTPRPEIRVDAVREDGAIRIDVADNGPGIDPGDVDQLFDGFFTTRPEGLGLGLGLGLGICRTILATHDGSIDVTSRTGERGAIFSVRLPLHPP